MENVISEIKDGKIVIHLPKKGSESQAVSAAAAELLSERFSYVIESLDNRRIGINILPKLGFSMKDQELSEIAMYLCNEISRKHARVDA